MKDLFITGAAVIGFILLGHLGRMLDDAFEVPDLVSFVLPGVVGMVFAAFVSDAELR